MAGSWSGRVLALGILAATIQYTFTQDFSIPDVKIEAFRPKGFRASIPDNPGTSLFVFQGNVNRDIGKNRVGALQGEVLQATGGRWVYENEDLELKVGDVINYYVFVSVNRVGYMKDNLSFTVTELKSRTDDGTSTVTCLPTVTTVRGGKACSGQVIFEDQFNSLRSDLWQVEQYIPIAHPEYPFVSYQRSTSGVVSVSDGYLHITPKLQQTLPGFNNESIYLGSLDLFSGCTASAEACYRQASGPDILPPVVSGRLTSSSFAFTYGTVYIKAKLPQGDWLYPEILLEPFLKKYGTSSFASGVIKIAAARGNRELRAGADEYGNKVLYGGPVMDFQCRHELLTNKFMTGGRLWGDDFHEYSISWRPDSITLSVDGEEWARVEADRPLKERLPQRCSLVPRMLLSKGTKLAPFDDYFYLTLGVAAGGISEFRDDTYSSGGKQKPWHNSGRKAMLNFWENLSAWQETWTQPELLVDYVKVVAL